MSEAKEGRLVGIVLVSHSAQVAASVAELAQKLAGGGTDVPVAPAGGTEGGEVLRLAVHGGGGRRHPTAEEVGVEHWISLRGRWLVFVRPRITYPSAGPVCSPARPTAAAAPRRPGTG